MTSLPDALVQFRLDLEEAIGREQAARLRKQHRRRIASLVAVAVAVIVGTASAYAPFRELFDPYAGRRVTRTVDGIRFSFRAPVPVADIWGNVVGERWENGPIEHVGESCPPPGVLETPPGCSFRTRNFLINKSTLGGQSAEAVVFWTVFPDGGQAAPCTKLLSSAGRSIADLAAAVARAPGIRVVTGPRRVTVGGRQAQRVVVTVQRSLGCDPGYFFTWRDEWWGAFWPGTYAGDQISMWIVDVGGKRLVIEAETKRPRSQYPPGYGGLRVARADVLKVQREIARIVESIRFE